MFYRCYLTKKIKAADLEERESGMIVIEPDDYSDDEIKEIKRKGYKLLAYLSVGTLEKERPWYDTYKKYKRKQLDDWPNEYYMNVKKSVWQKFLVQRAKDLKAKGFDGWWLDNLDVYSEYKSDAEFTACYAILQKIKKVGGYVMINGGSEFLDDAFDKKLKPLYVDGYTQEEVFSRILDYSGKGKFGKQKAEDKAYYKKMLIRAVEHGIQGFMLEYTKDQKVIKQIDNFFKKNGMSGYHISGDVNL